MLVRTVAPAVQPITLEEIKKHLNIDHGDDDEYLVLLVQSAAESIERTHSVALTTQTWQMTTDGWPAGATNIDIPLGPVQEISSITYLDSEGVSQVMDEDDYTVVLGESASYISLVTGASWPDLSFATAPVVVEFIVGYGDSASDVPMALKHGLKLIVGSLHLNRETFPDWSIMISPLLTPFRSFYV